MNFIYIKKIIKKKIEDHKKYKVLYLIAIIHFIRYCLSRKYRKNRCLIDPPADFFYKYKKLINYFSIPLLLVARYLKKKKIFISINNEFNYSMGHIYAEIDQIKRMQNLDKKYTHSVIWFTTSRKEILGETKDIFETNNFKILFGGLKRIFLTIIAINYPHISIDGSISHSNYIMGKNYRHRYVYNNLSKHRGKLMTDSKNFYPLKEKLKDYYQETKLLLQKLKIKKKYIVIQIKTKKVNGTLEPLSPDLYLKCIEYLQDKDYQIVFAGREKFPEIFSNNSIINYAQSKYASSLNDYLLLGNCSMVISAASGFCLLPQNLDKPLLVLNPHHISQYFGRRTIFLPTLLSRKTHVFNAKIQFEYLCRYGPDCGYKKFDDLYILHMPTCEEIFMAAKELEGMLSSIIPPFTPLQKKIRDEDGCPLLSCGLSRISDYYLTKHGFFFEKE